MRRFAVAVIIAATALGVVAQPAAAKDYKLGQSAKTGDFTVTVYAIQDPFVSSNPLAKPKAGNRLVTVDVQVTNKTKKQIRFSSLTGFHLLDSQHHQYDEDITIKFTLQPSSPDGKIPPKESVRGFVGFEIPSAATGLRLRVQGGFTASGAYLKLS